MCARGFIHCRIGSSEIDSSRSIAEQTIHCRIGSSETVGEGLIRVDEDSLPDRQLRKSRRSRPSSASNSLPDRQLRNNRLPARARRAGFTAG